MATFLGVAASDFTVTAGAAKAYVSDSGKGLDRSNLESFPGMVFVAIGSLDCPDVIEPKLEMFTKRRLHWAKPLDLPQFPAMPG
jgi:hypothetical protein